MRQRALLGAILIFVGQLAFGNMDASIADASIRFGSRDSAIKLSNSSTLDVVYGLTNNSGTIKQGQNASILGNDIAFSDGVFETNRSSLLITGSYQPDVSGTGTIILRGSVATPHRAKIDAGAEIELLLVGGGQNRLEGLPSLKNPIVFDDANTTLTIAIQSVLNKNIELNGGIIVLEDNLNLADNVEFVGTGTVKVNGRQLSLGGSDMSWTGSIYWNNAQDIDLRSSIIELSGTWTFDGENYVTTAGMGSIIDLTNSGTIWIRPNSSLYLSGIKLKGLGSLPGMGTIYFEDSSSKLYLRRSALELTTTYTIDQGEVIIQVGSSKIVTRDNTLYFEKPGGLTVEGVNLFYETRTFTDNNNIQPTVYNDVSSPIVITQNGDIMHYRTFQSFQGLASSYNDGKLNENSYLGYGPKNTRDIVAETPDVDGQGWFYHFARNKTNLLKIQAGVDATLTNIVLKDFNPHHVELASGSSLIFKDNVTIELGNDISFGNVVSSAVTWTFQGDCTIDGKGKVVSLQKGGILVQNLGGSGSTLILQDMILDGLEDGAISIASNESKVIFKDVKMILAENVSFSKGYFEASGEVEISSQVNGTEVKFIYDTDCTSSSKIQIGSMLHFDRGVTFSYAPSSVYKQLIDFADKSSVLSLNGANLFATNIGLQLTKGTLLADHKCTVSNGATTVAQAIEFGDGVNAANDLNIEIMPGGSIDAVYGILSYNNVNG